MRTSAVLDPVAAMAVIGAMLVSPGLADVLAPYAVIIIGASTGAWWSLGRRATRTRLGGFLFFGRINLTAALLSIGLAALLRPVLPASVDPQWLLAVVAFMLGAIGDDWPAIGMWVVERVGKVLDWYIARRMGGPK